VPNIDGSPFDAKVLDGFSLDGLSLLPMIEDESVTERTEEEPLAWYDVCMYIYVCMYVCMYVYMYVGAYTAHDANILDGLPC